MNELERMVWAAAYANAFARDIGQRPINDISGFSCAEIADVAVEKFREALVCDDGTYLIPVAEKWKGVLP